jgi:hypothetical protein
MFQSENGPDEPLDLMSRPKRERVFRDVTNRILDIVDGR